MEDGDVSGFEHFDDGPGVVAGRFNDLDAFVDDDLRVGGVVGGCERREEGKIHAEGFRGHGAAAADFGAEGFWGGLGERGEDAEATGVGDGGGELSEADPLHAALNDGDCGALAGRCMERRTEGGPAMPRASVRTVLRGMVM